MRYRIIIEGHPVMRGTVPHEVTSKVNRSGQTAHALLWAVDTMIPPDLHGSIRGYIYPDRAWLAVGRIKVEVTR
ncbi:MAG: hypothetical protein KatS3mg051_2067 [Anaerolineae bacterium]|nr:MAG: hypothetical protein KatS3mg051_2067 [Anaerolineae bacterium]